MNKEIEELKLGEHSYQIAMNYFYREKISKEEYLKTIDGKYRDDSPERIVEDICNIIKNL